MMAKDRWNESRLAIATRWEKELMNGRWSDKVIFVLYVAVTSSIKWCTFPYAVYATFAKSSEKLYENDEKHSRWPLDTCSRSWRWVAKDGVKADWQRPLDERKKWWMIAEVFALYAVINSFKLANFQARLLRCQWFTANVLLSILVNKWRCWQQK